ncbi:MAG: RNA 2',3'-cyclic phosphodiesterase [Anaerolineae bacterium]|nr:RNA 2',3'-cyclic phosphodiesterase [Anaerolineae bacterium]
MKTIRAFVAVELAAEVKQELGRVAGVLAGRVPERSVRWVKPELMHLTLRFLGETAVSKLDALTQTIDRAAQKQPALTLYLQGTGCFPHANRPRVIWAGLAGQVAELAAFKRELDAGLVPVGWAVEERPFKPHLTLGRVNDASQLRGVSWEVDMRKVMVEVTAVHLIESQLTRQGPIYTTRHTTHFS